MQAGRKLDAIVAERVFGWKVALVPGTDIYYQDVDTDPPVVPFYSTDIAAAWPIAQRFGLWLIPEGRKWIACRPESLSAKFYEPDMYVDKQVGIIDGHVRDLTVALTAPLAICMAALKIVGAKVPA